MSEVMTRARSFGRQAIWWSLAVVLFAAGAGLQAQDAPIEAPTLSELEARQTAVADDTGLTAETRTAALERYREAIELTRLAREREAELASLEARIRGAPPRIEEMRTRLADPAGALPEVQPIPPEADPQALRALIQEQEARLQVARDALRTEEQRVARLLEIPTSVPEEISVKTRQLAELEQALTVQDAADEASALREAKRALLEARKRLREVEIEILQRRLVNQEVLLTVATLRGDLHRAEIAARSEQLARLREVVEQRVAAEAEAVRAQAEQRQRDAATLPEAGRRIAQRNLELGAELASLKQREIQLGGRLEAAESQVEQLQARFESTRLRVEAVGPTQAIGRMLRRRLAELPELSDFGVPASERQAQLNAAIDRQIDLEERLRELSNLDRLTTEVVESIRANAEPSMSEQRLIGLRGEVRNLLEAERSTAQELQQVYGRYAARLASLNETQRRLGGEAQAFRRYIAEQLMWIPSHPPLTLADVQALPAALAWFVDTRAWRAGLASAVTELRQRWGAVLGGIGLIALLVYVRGVAIRRIDAIAPQTRKVRSDRFALTLKVLLYTLALGAVWASPLLLAGLFVLGTQGESQFHRIVGAGLVSAGVVVLTLRLLYHIVRPNGLALRHFRWSEDTSDRLRRHLGWLLMLAAPLSFLVGAGVGAGNDPDLSSLSRPAFLVLMLAVAVFIWLFLRQRRSADPSASPSFRAEGGSWLLPLRFVWLPVLIGLPLMLAGLSASGYHFTAIELERRLAVTAWFLLGVILLRDLLLRWFYVAERRLRFDDAVRRRAELRAAREQEEREGEVLAVEEPEIDFGKLGDQAERLLRTGLLFGIIIGVWWIWADLLPALNVLGRMAFPFMSGEIVPGAEAEGALTLADIGLTLVILVVTTIAAKNLPGVLEIALLQRLPIDHGGRYAITTLAQYLIVGIGLVSAFGTLGVEWSKLQWLVAALGVGLGFGLQEIVANFISGIILLFERPVRVGDVVTLGDSSGVVSRIRIRATTIRNWDQQELIVPNKEFITGRLLNWTLSDKLYRVVLPVGIAYGSDVGQAMRLLDQAARNHPVVLADPKPLITLDGFGDNALQLTLRCFLPNLDGLLTVPSELRETINTQFNAAGITIAFPQRDVHLASDQPLELRLLRGRDIPQPR